MTPPNGAVLARAASPILDRAKLRVLACTAATCVRAHTAAAWVRACVATAVCAGIAVAGCAAPSDPPVPPIDRDSLIDTYGLAPVARLEIPYPPDNPRNEERIELGRLLFFDPLLGGERDVSCATCHHPDFAFADGRPRSVGVGGGGPDGRALGPERDSGVSAVTGLPIVEAARNAPTVLNAGLIGRAGADLTHLSEQFWDGRAALGLEGQALEPLAARDEMAGDAYGADRAVAAVILALRETEEYEDRFRAAFPDEAEGEATAIDLHKLERAIAAFERELVTPNSPFDQWLEGDDDALTRAQQRGLALFFGSAGCGQCHSGPMLSDRAYHALGVVQTGPGRQRTRGDDYGRQEATGDPSDLYAFRTPSLRNAALTAPYMHDGAVATLREAVEFFDRGGNDRGLPPGVVSDLVQPLGLSPDEIADLVSFLESLTGDPPDVEVPDRVPSGLEPVNGVASSS